MTPLNSQLTQIPDLHHIFYTDDYTLWCSSGSPGHVEDTLQRGLDPIDSFLITAGLSPAPEKSQLHLNHSSSPFIFLALTLLSQERALPPPRCHDLPLRNSPPAARSHSAPRSPRGSCVHRLYKAALKLPITTSAAKLLSTGLFHPLRSLLSLHRDSRLARLSLTRQGQRLLAQAGISHIPASTLPCRYPPRLPTFVSSPSRPICPPSCMAAVVTRPHSTIPPPLFTNQGVAYPDASFVAHREYTIYSDYQAAIDYIQIEPHPTPFTPTGGRMSGPRTAVFHRFPPLPLGGLWETLPARHHQGSLPPALSRQAPINSPHQSVTVPEARLLRHIQMNVLITPSRLFLYCYRSDPSCPNCPSTYADLSHCLFFCPAAQQSASYPPLSLLITTWLDWLGAEGEEQRPLFAKAVDMLGL
ncbi:hypothetical protein HPB49_021189 [Dermacentor silvarum]|uniref:Uncharacterized protein n=1 Tax=Dermacentor silvarum TaxID=543639 RepID=A0ACB8DFU8_DERSI|nr:hypothetical protein HPB49_021189 [Dermacentor silvarum]